MFRLAGCGFDDLRAEVEAYGLDPTLDRLRGAGVYLTNDEFKGKRPIVRSGKTIPATTADFRNSLVTGNLRSSSGASRSQGTQTPISTECLTYREGYHRLWSRQHRLDQSYRIEVKPLPPGTAGLNSVLAQGRMGLPSDRWFAFGGPFRDSAHYRGLTTSLMLLARLQGVKVPFPEHLPPDDFSPVARLIAEKRSEGRAVYVASFASAGARIAVAAKELGLDISGTTFALGSEAVTEAKRRAVEDVGCTVVVRYWVSEIGPIGFGCARLEGRGVHLFREAHAIRIHRRKARLSEVEVDAIQFTTLLPFAPYALINTEMDDTGRIESVECDCAFHKMGFTEAM
ncbi:MAG: hypothetical protein GY953_53550, partial [bacterium]|nr:hypothetical protein [bacterium]